MHIPLLVTLSFIYENGSYELRGLQPKSIIIIILFVATVTWRDPLLAAKR